MNPNEATSSSYVTEMPNGGWRVAGSRVSLDSIVHAYREGESPEQISQNFPSLSLEQVYGAMAYYLHNQKQIDRYLVVQAERWDTLQREADERNAKLRERILSRRQFLPW